MTSPHCNPACTDPEGSNPSDETLGIYSAKGHVMYSGGGSTEQQASLVFDDEAGLHSIWRREGEPKGVPYRQFKAEAEGLGSSLVMEAVKVTGPAQEALLTLPGNMRLRYIRICVCWRWICIYVWIRL
jgi:hypothetical protein